MKTGNDVVREGDWVLIYFSDKHRYTVRVERGKKFHTTLGSIALDALVGLEYGSESTTNVGEKFVLSKPSIVDLLSSFKRFTQVIYPKDLGYILLSSGVGPGARVVEAGTGTGYLASVLAFYVRPSGRVYTYEIRKDFYEKALSNFELVGLLPYITAKNKDVREGIEEENVDAVFLDLPDPWRIVDDAFEKLVHGGNITVFVPTMNQVEKTVIFLKKAKFKMIEVVEIMMRRIKAVEGEVRPETIGVWHTGYVISARKP